MRLKLEIPESWPEKAGAKGVYEPEPGVILSVGPLQPLPEDLRAWGDEVVLAGVDLSMYRVRNVDDLHTVRGWPVSIFFSDILSILPESPDALENREYAPKLFGDHPDMSGLPSASRVRERRLHALYRFDEFCGAAIARSAALPRFDAVLPELRRVLLTGEPDWTDGRVPSIADLWRGLHTFRPPEPSALTGEQASAQEPNQVK